MVTKIMVAEDNTSVYSCYQNFLSKDETIEFIGHASDGELDVEMYKKKNPDLMLLDLRIPKKNGLEILNEITKYESENIKCNVVVISGDSELRPPCPVVKSISIPFSSKNPWLIAAYCGA